MLKQFEILVDLHDRYCQPHRHYHTLAHVGKMFDCAADHALALTQEEVLAVWFHDSVYDPVHPAQNEELSSALAFSYVYSLGGNAMASVVKTIILDTKEHIPTCMESPKDRKSVV